MSGCLEGKNALVTGATSGIGRSVASAMAANGAGVVVSGRNAARGDAVVEEIRRDGGRAVFVQADLTDRASVLRLAREALDASGGRVDILVNNAGIYPFTGTEETSEEVYDQTFAVNVKAPFFLVAALAPAMADRGQGAVINLSSMAAGFAMPGGALYGATKAALELLTKAWATEFGPRGVRVNAVAPGTIRTEGVEAMGEEFDHQVHLAPAGRAGRPEEIADAVVFLAADTASFVQGTVLAVDGGRVAV
ncbi:SDR family NAD(P)-dependent oxidoreductase [Sphaerisporangium sp. TRM90804]|uniref:SDR family NAD(P)-dependent oxidoreductase n=1 Tax=Sphaerisporangium sp. TRM90804 TaxID=3031113 RepID=UPI00244D62D0|nr:SDR family NAD(P)-dependent oxidoreductase [Sphaerisporangium sp. TRM90804]MDH2424449.1 SDR family NAD(P)-dependent oxidoreductase [Sphaerisporangium sp. TRM90804]